MTTDTPPPPGPRVGIERLSSPRAWRDELAEDVRLGLTDPPRQLPSKYFYDGRGSRLFEAITHLPEYYLARAETEILQARAGEIVETVGPAELVELGSGSSRKTRLLLEALRERGTGHRYVPIDVSEEALLEAANALTGEYPWLEVQGLLGDFQDAPGRLLADRTRLVAFLGSTIGNLDRAERAVLLADVARMLGPDDAFLLGADLVKSREVLVAAYDDAQGVTAEFNRNVLRVVNRELDADFPVEAFAHVVRWNPEQERIESSLRAPEQLSVHVGDLDLHLELTAGEEIHTELSCKFRREGLAEELGEAGMAIQRWFTDDRARFALLLARPA